MSQQHRLRNDHQRLFRCQNYEVDKSFTKADEQLKMYSKRIIKKTNP